jgi:hypothetical protein
MTIREMPLITPIDIEQDGIIYQAGSTLYPTNHIVTPPTSQLTGINGGLTVGGGSNTPPVLYDDNGRDKTRLVPDTTGYTVGNANSGIGGGIGLTDSSIPATQQARLSTTLSEPVVLVGLVLIAYFIFAT